MSLINKALKKEQQRRIGSPPDAALYTLSSHSPARARQRQDNRNITILVGFVCMGLFVLGLSGAFVYFGSQYLAKQESGDGAESSTALASSEQIEEASTSAPKSIIKKAEDAASKNDEIATQTDTAAASPKESSKPIAATPGPAIASAQTAAVPAPINPEADLIDPNEQIDRNGDPEIWAFVDGLKIQGIRAAGAQSRLLLNGRVYKIGFTIDRRFGLKFKDADEQAIYFEDQHGRIYDKML